MAFPPGFLDELRARTNLAELIGRRVKLTRRGREHVGLCPFHNEKTPSFTVSEDKGFYHCFGCGAHGDAISFLMNTEGLAFPESVERLAGAAGLAVPRESSESKETRDHREQLLATVEAAAGWYEAQLAAVGGAEARAYLERRGLSPATVRAFRLGYAPPERGALRRALAAQGFGDSLLAEAGLIKLPEPEEAGGAPEPEPRDYLFNRVVFPITDSRERVIAFGGRTLGESRAKYLNSPDGPLFHKGHLLYNLPKARQAARSSGELLLVEGYMDVIALAEAGFPAAVAPLGTALTEEQIGLAWRFVAEPVLCLDGDEAGRRAAGRAAERALPLLKPGQSLRFALLPAGEDPDSLVRRQGPSALRGLLQDALPLVDLVWHLALEGRPLDTPERRAGLRRDLRERLNRIADKEVQSAYWDEMQARLDALFRRPGRGERPAQGRGGPGRRAGRNGFGRPERRLDRRGDPDVTVPPLSRNRPATLGRLRHEQILLAALVNHPELLFETAEPLAALSLENRDLGRLLAALLDLAAYHEDLDRSAIHGHLCDQGFSGLLADLLHWRVYKVGPFARPEAAPAEVKAAWGPFFGRLAERRTRDEATEVY